MSDSEMRERLFRQRRNIEGRNHGNGRGRRFALPRPDSTKQKVTVVSFLVVLGLVSVPVAVASPWVAGTSATSAVASAVADTEHLGVNTAPSKFISSYTPTTVQYESDLNVDGADKNVDVPSALRGRTFAVSPLKSIHFRDNGADWYAYIFPTGQGQRAADSVMDGDTLWGRWDGFSGALTRFVYGDVVLFVSAVTTVDSNAMADMVETIAPNCQLSAQNDWRGEDWKRNKVFAGDSFRDLEISHVVGGSEDTLKEWSQMKIVEDVDDNTTLLSKSLVESVNSLLPEPVPDEPEYPSSEPTSPERPVVTATIGVKVPDTYGPGCGWNYTDSVGAPTEDDNASINSDNTDRIASVTKKIDEDISAYMKSYSEYSKKWEKWKKQRDTWLDFQTKVLDAYAQNPASVNPILPEIADGSVYPYGDPYQMEVQ